MMSVVLYNKFKSLIVLLYNLLRRALCCFRKRRRPSEDFAPLTQIGVVPNETHSAEVQWGDHWGDFALQKRDTRPSTIEEHIQHYRQQTIAARQDQPTEEAQEDFFEDMTPNITRQKKVLIGGNESNGQSKLSFVADNVNVISNELGEWDDSGGWEDETMGDDIQGAVREAKRQARQKRAWEQQQKRQEKFVRPTLGAKVVS